MDKPLISMITESDLKNLCTKTKFLYFFEFNENYFGAISEDAESVQAIPLKECIHKFKDGFVFVRSITFLKTVDAKYIRIANDADLSAYTIKETK